MKSLLLSALLIPFIAQADEPLKLSNYNGTLGLTRQADGAYAFRLESFAGEGILDDVGDLAKGQRYVVSGTLHCSFGAKPSSVFDCASDFGSLPKLHVQVLEGLDGRVLKEADVEADYVKMAGRLVTTTTVTGDYQQTVVETNVYGRTLNLDLALSF